MHWHSVEVHLFKLSDGKPHPRARTPLLRHDIPLEPTECGWQIEAVIWENGLGCLFTSNLENELVNILIVWDWATGNIVQVRASPPAHSFLIYPLAGAISARQLLLHIS